MYACVPGPLKARVPPPPTVHELTSLPPAPLLLSALAQQVLCFDEFDASQASQVLFFSVGCEFPGPTHCECKKSWHSQGLVASQQSVSQGAIRYYTSVQYLCFKDICTHSSFLSSVPTVSSSSCSMLSCLPICAHAVSCNVTEQFVPYMADILIRIQNSTGSGHNPDIGTPVIKQTSHKFVCVHNVIYRYRCRNT